MLFNLGWATYYDYRATGCGYMGSYTSSMPRSIFVVGLLSLVVFLLRLLFQQCVRFCFLFSCIVCESFAGHFDNTIVSYQQPLKLHFKNTMVPYQLPIRLTLRNVAVRLLRNTCLFSDFSQCTQQIWMYFQYIATSKPTYTCVLQCSPTSGGLAQARPNY